MDIFKMTDKELVDYATPVLSQLIDACNAKDWEKFSAPFHEKGKSAEGKEDVLDQWENKPYLSSFKQEFTSLGVIRRSDHVATIWKLLNHLSEDEILGVLCFEYEHDEVKVSAYRVF